MIDRKELYNKKRESLIHYFDIDGTITVETEGWDYANRTPRLEVIDKIRVLYNSGVSIVFWTARMKIDRAVTLVWLAQHDVPFDLLVTDKPYWDVYICDKSFNVEDWLNG